MATSDFRLSTRPTDPRKRELWLEHAAGFILFQDMRDYAIQQIDESLDADSRAAAMKGIDDAVYGLMMILDGVTGALTNDSQRVNLRVAAEFIDCNNDETILSLDLMDGDGMCMGYHGWLENEYGDTRPFVADED